MITASRSRTQLLRAAMALCLALGLVAPPSLATAQSGPHRVENRLHNYLRAGARAGWEDRPSALEGEFSCALQNRTAPLRLVVSTRWSAPCPATARTCERSVLGREAAAYLRDPVATAAGSSGWGRITDSQALTGPVNVNGQNYPNGAVVLRDGNRLEIVLGAMNRLTAVDTAAAWPVNLLRLETGLVGQMRLAGNSSPVVCRRTDRDQLRRMLP